MLAPNQFVSFWDMLELHALGFMSATIRLSEMRSIVQNATVPPTETVAQTTIDHVAELLNEFEAEAQKVSGKLAVVAAQRLRSRLLAIPCTVNWAALATGLQDIESRFADELGFIKLFVVDQTKAVLFGGADELLGEQTASLFPSVWFDCEEASKCLCLGRPTACVFHCMRMLEVAIKALAKRLTIEDPVKPAQRNWGVMLRTIKEKMDSTYPPSARTTGSEGVLIEKLYLSLDAVKNPWRNDTMHVEGVYTDAEAQHILQCVAVLLQTMAQGFDEKGYDADVANLIG